MRGEHCWGEILIACAGRTLLGEILVTGEGRSFLQRVSDEDPISVHTGARRGYIE